MKNLIKKLSTDFPDITFEKSDNFIWNPDKKTIFYSEENTPFSELSLIHELAHSVLGHTEYEKDTDLIKFETKAWELVEKNLAKKYDINFNEDFAQSELDSYRDWLHKRSLCPNCNLNGIQIDQKTYYCPICQQKWTVNEAKFTRLKRSKVKNRS